MEPNLSLAGVTSVTVMTAAPTSDLQDFYAATYPRLVATVALVTGSSAEAEDCVQEAFIRLMGAWPSVSRYDDPEGWTRRVAFRLASNKLRKARNGAKALLGGRLREQAPADSTTNVELTQALRRLPLGQRQVVVLHYLFDMTVAEVARELGLPQGTVKSRLSRARASLADLLTAGDSND